MALRTCKERPVSVVGSRRSAAGDGDGQTFFASDGDDDINILKT